MIDNLKNLANILKKDNLLNFVLFLTIALSVGYLVNKTYHAIVLLYIIALLMYLLCKNVACSLGISIILTNLILSLNIVNQKESMSNHKAKKATTPKKENLQNKENLAKKK